MGKFEKGNKVGKLFSKTRQPKKNGRKPSRMNEFIKAFDLDNGEKQISKDDAIRLLTHCLMCNRAELERMTKNTDLPIAVLCQIKAIVTDMNNGTTSTVDKLFDRIFGKAVQKTEITGADGSPIEIESKTMTRKDFEKQLLKLKGLA